MLGEADVNISFMHVGRRGPRMDAIMVLGIDEPSSQEILEMLTAVSHINWLRAVTL